MKNTLKNRRSTQKGGTKVTKPKNSSSSTKKVNPIVNRNAYTRELEARRKREVERRLDIEQAKKKDESNLQHLTQNERNRARNNFDKSIQSQIKKRRQEERNQGYETDNGNRSVTNYSSEYSNNETFNQPARKSSSKASSKTSSEPVIRPVDSRVYKSKEFSNMRERAKALIAEAAEAEATRQEEPIQQASMAVSNPQSWWNYFGKMRR